MHLARRVCMKQISVWCSGAKQESGKRKSLEAKEQPGNRKSLEDKVGDDPAYHCAVKGQPLADPNKESHTLQGTIGMPA